MIRQKYLICGMEWKEWSSIKIIDWYIINPDEKGNKIKSTKFYFDAHHQPLLSGIMCVFI